MALKGDRRATDDMGATAASVARTEIAASSTDGIVRAPAVVRQPPPDDYKVQRAAKGGTLNGMLTKPTGAIQGMQLASPLELTGAAEFKYDLFVDGERAAQEAQDHARKAFLGRTFTNGTKKIKVPRLSELQIVAADPEAGLATLLRLDELVGSAHYVAPLPTRKWRPGRIDLYERDVVIYGHSALVRMEVEVNVLGGRTLSRLEVQWRDKSGRLTLRSLREVTGGATSDSAVVDAVGSLVGKNSRNHKGDAFAYALVAPDGTIHKFGATTRAEREQELRRELFKATGENHRYQILEEFDDVASARDAETLLIQEHIRKFGCRPPGNLSDR